MNLRNYISAGLIGLTSLTSSCGVNDCYNLPKVEDKKIKRVEPMQKKDNWREEDYEEYYKHPSRWRIKLRAKYVLEDKIERENVF